MCTMQCIVMQLPAITPRVQNKGDTAEEPVLYLEDTEQVRKLSGSLLQGVKNSNEM